MFNWFVFGLIALLAATGVIGPTSAVDPEAEAAPQKREPITDSRAYAQEIRRLIDARKTSPGYEGESRVMTRFTLRRSGELVQVAIEPGSAPPAAERAAISIIQDASREFPPFPDAVDQEEQTYSLKIAFSTT